MCLSRALFDAQADLSWHGAYGVSLLHDALRIDGQREGEFATGIHPFEASAKAGSSQRKGVFDVWNANFGITQTQMGGVFSGRLRPVL